MEKFVLVNPDERFCGFCGQEKKPVLTENPPYFDAATGTHMHRLRCDFKSCLHGHDDIPIKQSPWRQFKINWGFDVIQPVRCLKCGRESQEYTGAYD